MKTLYMTKATARGGRDGHVESDDGNFRADLSIPKSLGGPGKPGATNPEQLFAAGYAACFESAVRHVARLGKIPVSDLTVEAHVGLIPDQEGFALTVSLHLIFSGIEKAVAEQLVEAADRVCPYSKALRNNVKVAISIEVKES